MSTKYIYRPTAIIPVAAQPAINAYFTRQGLGPIFHIALVIGPNQGIGIVKDSEPLVTHYGTSLPLDEAWSGILNRRLAEVGGQRVEKLWSEALTDLSAKRDQDSHPYQLIMVVTPAARTATITRLTASGVVNADARFFKIGLSTTGAAPITRYVDYTWAAPNFAPTLKQIADNLPRTEIFIGVRDGNIKAVKDVYGDPKYQNPDFANRTFARVWLELSWTAQEVLQKLNLKVVT